MDLASRFALREDLHQSLSYATLMESIGWSSIPISGSRLSLKLLGPTGVAKLQRASHIDMDAIRLLKRQLHLSYVVIEPALKGEVTVDRKTYSYDTTNENVGDLELINIIKSAHWMPRQEYFAHTKTLLLDISPSLATIISHFPSKARYNAKLSSKRDTICKTIPLESLTSLDLAHFEALHESWSKERHIFGFTPTFLRQVFANFNGKGALIFASSSDKLLGALLVLTHSGVGNYYYTCALNEGHKNHIPTRLLLEGIIYSKAKGCDIFDFFSAYDERYPSRLPRWQGFSTFKTRFAPEPIYYPQSFSKRFYEWW